MCHCQILPHTRQTRPTQLPWGSSRLQQQFRLWWAPPCPLPGCPEGSLLLQCMGRHAPLLLKAAEMTTPTHGPRVDDEQHHHCYSDASTNRCNRFSRPVPPVRHLSGPVTYSKEPTQSGGLCCSKLAAVQSMPLQLPQHCKSRSGGMGMFAVEGVQADLGAYPPIQSLCKLVVDLSVFCCVLLQLCCQQ